MSAESVLADNFVNITVEMGLSNSSTFSVIQDEKGLMWFSTKEGIDRYDGTSFKNYMLYDSHQITKYGLRRNQFHVDACNKIWVYNFSDIFTYDRTKDRFVKIYSLEGDNIIRDIFVDDNQNVIYLATDKGLVSYYTKTKIYRLYPEITLPIASLTQYSENLLILVNQDAIYFFDTKTNKLDNTLPTDELKREISKLKDISCACVDRSKSIYLASLGQVCAFRPGDKQLRRSPKLDAEIGVIAIAKIVSDKTDAIFFGTPGKGLFKIDTMLNLKKSYYLRSDNNAETNANDVVDIFIDDNNRLWIAGNSISFLNNQKLNFQYYKNNKNEKNSLYNSGIRSFIEDAEGNLWVGTNDGISILSRDRKQWSYLNPRTNNHRVSGNKIMTLGRDNSGNIYAGTAQDGLFRIDRNLLATPIDYGQERIYKSTINALLVSGDELWSGGSGSSLNKRDLKTGKTDNYPISDVLCVIKSRNNRVITGGHSGLHIINAQGNVKKFDASRYNIGSIFCIAEDQERTLWLASEGQGLIKFNPEDESFQKFTVASGLSSDLVYGIVQDPYGNLWLSTTKGVSCFNIKREEFKNYTLDDGLPIKEFVYGAYGSTRNGEIILGGNKGFIIFNPRELLDFDLQTNLIITDFKIFNKSVEIDANHSPLQQSIDETKFIKLKHDQNSLTFEFSSINLVNNANYYQWKLDGFDQGWSPITKINYANYTNLKHGSYKLVIQWTNTGSHSQIEMNSREIYIEIEPPFWKTSLAYLFYTIFLIGLIYAVVKFYMVRLSERQAKDKIQSFVNIVHDIRTPLSLIKSPLQLAIKKRDFSDETLEILKKANNNASRLTKLADQLMDLDSEDYKKNLLKLSYITLEQTLDSICEDFIPLMEHRGIVFTKKYQNNETLLAVDIDKFDKIIFNILSNAIKYSREKGHIVLSTAMENDKIKISITDNGIGIPKEQQKQLFKRYFRVDDVVNSTQTGFGIGLMITKELVTLHGGEIWLESALDKGTTFYITFPMNAVVSTESDSERIVADDNDTEKKKDGHRAKVLIVEDNDDLRNIMISHLKYNYKVSSARNGFEALKAINKSSIDVIVSDIMMPVMDGAELCFEVKNSAKTNHIPVILLTALSSNEHKAEGYRIGADIYLEKPVDIDLLTNCINNLLDNRRKIKDKFVHDEYTRDEMLTEADVNFIEQVRQITELNLSNTEYSAEYLEHELGISRANLYRKFKDLFSKTPLEFITQYRLNKSIEFLQSGKYYVNETAYMVGFSDPKYFSIVFKKYFGKNASDFLKNKK